MPVDWEKLENKLPDIINNAADETDEALASRISSLTSMKDEEIMELFPTQGDVEKLARLMKIVQSAEARSTKINTISSNVEEFGGIILTLLTKFV